MVYKEIFPAGKEKESGSGGVNVFDHRLAFLAILYKGKKFPSCTKKNEQN
jgi:hypothetical protein